MKIAENLTGNLGKMLTAFSLFYYIVVLIVDLLSAGIPYSLPKMTERYFYYADTTLMLLAMVNSRFLVLALLQESAPLISYWAYYSSITGSNFIPVFAAAFIIGFELITLIIVVYYSKNSGGNNELFDYY